MTTQVDMDKIVSLCKRRGFIFPSSEIYGGLGSTYDYGPLGVELKNNVKRAWWRANVQERDDMVGLDAAILMHPRVWEASGHVAGFSDPLVECKSCHHRFRADHIWVAEVGPADDLKFLSVYGADRQQAEGELQKRSGGGPITEIFNLSNDPRGFFSPCPSCGAIGGLISPRMFNLMFKTFVGPVDPQDDLFRDLDPLIRQKGAVAPSEVLLLEDLHSRLRVTIDEGKQRMKAALAYLRPETAQGIFVNFQNVLQSSRRKLPFGIAQIGKAFRNEITPGNFTFRTREFEQMEIEFFVRPGTDAEWLERWVQDRFNWYLSLGMRKENLRLRPHGPDELAHYARACYDIEYLFPWGWSELEGIANRTDFDLRQHAEYSGKDLSYFDEDPSTGSGGERYLPYVIEPSAGADRATLAFLVDAYREEEVRGPSAGSGQGERRVVLRLDPNLAPIKVAVLPLSRNEALVPTAREVYALVRRHFMSQYDDAQSIGRRYRRQDEIGTPLCVTIDFDTLEDKAVTIRERDSMEQARVPLSELVGELRARLEAS